MPPGSFSARLLREIAILGGLLSITIALAVALMWTWEGQLFPNTQVANGTVTLKDGTRLAAESDAHYRALLAEHSGNIRSSTFRTADTGFGSLGAIVGCAVLVAMIIYVVLRDRARLKDWLRWSWTSAGLGVAGAIVTLTLGVGYDSLIRWLGFKIPDELLDWRQLLDSVWVLGLLGVVLAPIAEELFFRGRLFDALAGRWGVPVAIGTTSLLFAGAHVVPITLPITFALGLVFGFLRQKTGTLVAPILAHAIHNAMALFVLG